MRNASSWHRNEFLCFALPPALSQLLGKAGLSRARATLGAEPVEPCV